VLIDFSNIKNKNTSLNPKEYKLYLSSINNECLIPEQIFKITIFFKSFKIEGY
jgi:hypothetical protein